MNDRKHKGSNGTGVLKQEISRLKNHIIAQNENIESLKTLNHTLKDQLSLNEKQIGRLRIENGEFADINERLRKEIETIKTGQKIRALSEDEKSGSYLEVKSSILKSTDN